MGFILMIFVTTLVAIFNIVIRKMNIKLIHSIGYDTHSERSRAIMTSIFIASFLNTGVVLLLTNANLENTFLNFLPIKNQFPDFTRDWYIVVGG